ncbi:MAG: hypothetical protein Q9227_009106 [Pyrenula ochraceoflavens]
MTTDQYENVHPFFKHASKNPISHKSAQASTSSFSTNESSIMLGSSQRHNVSGSLKEDNGSKVASADDEEEFEGSSRQNCESASVSSAGLHNPSPSHNIREIDKDSYPNKRRKRSSSPSAIVKHIDPSNEATNNIVEQNSGGSWLDQLKQAADLDTATLEKNRKPRTRTGRNLSKSFDKASPDPESATGNANSSRQVDRDLEIPPARNDIRKRATSPNQKILKINSNGKLLSSPADKALKSPRTKPTGETGLRANPADKDKRLCIIIKYGRDIPSRLRLGEKIEGILHGKSKVSQIINQDSELVKIQDPKPTHPFFLGKIRSKSCLELDVQVSSQKPSARERSDPTSPTTRSDPSNRNARQGRNPSCQNLLHSSTNSRSPRRISSQRRELWPPKGMVRVGDSSKPKKSSSSNLQYKKLKGAQSYVEDSENLISLTKSRLQKALNPKDIDKRGPSEYPRAPQKLIVSGPELLAYLERDQRHTNQLRLSGQCEHPASRHLLQHLPESMSSFDLGQCDNLSWCSKYAPKTSEDVLQAGPEATLLRDWLKVLTVSAVDQGFTTGSSKPTAARGTPTNVRKRRKKRPEDLDGFLVSSDDEQTEMAQVGIPNDELAPVNVQGGDRSVMRASGLNSKDSKTPVSNCILLSGPSGCGKTASVYAAANELGFEVFEVNSGSRRGAKEIFERVGDMTQNHLVHKARPVVTEMDATINTDETGVFQQEIASGKQGTMNNFFRSEIKGPRKSRSGVTKKVDVRNPTTPDSNGQKQSLILVEEVDILYEDDKAFWTGIQAIIKQSKRPVVLTCTDEKLVPIADLPLQGILRFDRPPIDLALDYLLLLALAEGHYLSRDDVSVLFASRQYDLRASICELQVWCQMAVGSQEGGLDWMVERWPPGKNLNSRGHRLRTISCKTLTADLIDGSLHGLVPSSDASSREKMEATILERATKPVTAVTSSLEQISPCKNQDAHNDCGQKKNQTSLGRFTEIYDARSNFDLLMSYSREESLRESVDASCLPMSSRQKTDLNEGYTLIHAGIREDYTRTTLALATTYALRTGQVYHDLCRFPQHQGSMHHNTSRTLNDPTPSETDRDLVEVFACLESEEMSNLPSSSGWMSPTLDRSASLLAVDVAPFIRSIVAFDVRLEQQRSQMDNLSRSSTISGKKARTTRASRAALEGGNKANTRKERWFSKSLDIDKVLSTAGPGWQEAAANCLSEEDTSGLEPVQQLEGGSP